MRPTMHENSKAFFDAITPPEGKDATPAADTLYEMVEPLHDVLEHVRAHLTEVDRLRRAADRTEENVAVHTHFEKFKSTVKAGHEQCAHAIAAIEALTDTCYQIGQYAREVGQSLDTHELRTTDATTHVTIPKRERDELQSRIDALALHNTELDGLLTKAHRELDILRGPK